jgi:hypothetical protein
VSGFVHGRVYIAGAFRVGLGLVGPKYISVVYLTDGDRAVVGRLDARDARTFRPLAGYSSPRRLALRLLRGRKVSDMTKGARAILLRAKGIE